MRRVYGRSMTELTNRYTTISDGFTSRLESIGADQWEQNVPSCPEWTVGQLVRHVLGTHNGTLSTIGKSATTEGADSELAANFAAARAEIITALDDPEVSGKTIQGPLGESKFSDLAGSLLIGDTLFHTWDLAHATGQDETLDEESCVAVLRALGPLDEAIRRPGFFGPKLSDADDTDAQSRLLSFGGRQH